MMTTVPNPTEKSKTDEEVALEKWETRLNRSQKCIIRFVIVNVLLFCAVLYRTAQMHAGMIRGNENFLTEVLQTAGVAICFAATVSVLVEELFDFFKIKSEKPYPSK